MALDYEMTYNAHQSGPSLLQHAVSCLWTAGTFL